MGVLAGCGFGVLDGLSSGPPKTDTDADVSTSGGSDTAGAGGAGEIATSAGPGGEGGSSGSAGEGGNAGAGGGGSVPSDGGCPTCAMGLALYWKFDEAGGTAATDSSGNGFNGLYTGVSLPVASTNVPPVAFADPSSRAFSLSAQQAVKLASAPLALKPPNNFTVALWYRSTKTDTTGSEILSLGDVYFLRIQTTPMTGIYWTKYSAVDAVTKHYVPCFSPIANALDGGWHHIAGVASPAGTTFYFDGNARCSDPDGGNVAYVKGTDFWVARHGLGSATFNFDGNIDELRVYSRALTLAEIQGLARGEGAKP